MKKEIIKTEIKVKDNLFGMTAKEWRECVYYAIYSNSMLFIYRYVFNIKYYDIKKTKNN